MAATERYIIVQADSIRALQKKVNLHLDVDYITQGGVCYDTSTKRYLQSMILNLKGEQRLDDELEDEDEVDCMLNDEGDSDVEPDVEPAVKPTPVEIRYKQRGDLDQSGEEDYKAIRIEDIEDLPMIVFNRLKDLKINTIGELLKAIDSDEYKQKLSENQQKVVTAIIQREGWK
jgi:hypothetical protein